MLLLNRDEIRLDDEEGSYLVIYLISDQTLTAMVDRL